MEKIRRHCRDSNKKVLLDMREIKKVDIDVLMYLKYIVYEAKVKRMKKCIMSFIPPKDKKLKKFIYSTGFVTNYKNRLVDNLQEESFSSRRQVIMKNEGEGINFKIKHGTTLNRKIAKNIVDFTRENIHTSRICFLYSMISEMMENTVVHAYMDDENIEHKDWFIFAEKVEDKIVYVFLDGGLGITETIQKKITDKIPWKNKSELLISALKGEKRTRTKKVNRGKGLPFILDLQKKGEIQNLRIVTNTACYNLNNNQDDIKKELKGTFFYWEIKGDKK